MSRPVDARPMAEAGIRVARMAEFSSTPSRDGRLEFGGLERAATWPRTASRSSSGRRPRAARQPIAEHPNILPVDTRASPLDTVATTARTSDHHRESRFIVAALAERYGADERIVVRGDLQRVRRALLLPALRGRLPRRGRGAATDARLDEHELGHGLLEPPTYTWDHINVLRPTTYCCRRIHARLPSPAHALDYCRAPQLFGYSAPRSTDPFFARSPRSCTTWRGFSGSGSLTTRGRRPTRLLVGQLPAAGGGGGLAEPAPNCDAIRGLKDAPFWVMEQ